MAIASRNAWRDAVIAWAGVGALVTVLVQWKVEIPAIGSLGAALVAVLFLYMPVLAAWYRKEDLDDYGFHLAPLKRGALTAGIAIGTIFPVFAVGYFAFYEVACHSHWLVHLVPHGTCAKFSGWRGVHWPHVTLEFGKFCGMQLITVALPEEMFFRGFLLGLLEERFPPKRRILGGGVGWALVISAAMFALVHLPKEGDPLALATFFPGLLFGWMRSSTKSIFAGTITHAGSNVLIKFLDLTVLR